MKKWIIFLVIGLIVAGGIIMYIILNHPNDRPSPGMNRGRNPPGPGVYNQSGNFTRNAQLDDKTKEEIISFFKSTQDINQIKDYCDKNRFYCMYYCMEIDKNNEICSQMQQQRPINRTA